MQQYNDGDTRNIGGVTYTRQGGQWIASQPAAAPAQSVTIGTPRGPDPMEQGRYNMALEANQRAERADARAAASQGRADETAARAAAAAERAALSASRLGVSDTKDLQEKVSALRGLKQSVDGFKDDYSGFGAGIENAVQGLTGSIGSPGQREWWANFKTVDNIVRNKLFGASLSQGEKSAYGETTVGANLDPKIVRGNLNRRYEQATSELRNYVNALKAGGYSSEQIDALLGDIGPALNPPDPRASNLDLQNNEQTPQGFRMSGEQAKQFTSYLSRNKGKLTPDGMAAAYEAITGLGLDPAHSQEVIAFINGGGDPAAIGVDYTKTDEAATLDAQHLKEQYGKAGAQDLITQGATLGLSDEASGVGNMIANAASAPFSDTTNFDPAGAYTAGRDAERMRLDDARQQMGWGGTALEIGGGLLGGGMGVRNALAGPASLGTRMVEGAKMGGGMGAAAGFGYGEGGNSLLSAAGGAVTGGVLGAAIPVAGQVIGNRVGGLARMTGRDPALPRRIVNEAIEADGNTPQAAGQMLDQAQGRGSPMMLADTGENARGLLASVGRQPGPSRRMVQEAVGNRQNAQAERISEAVARDLGPTANIREMGDQLIQTARTQAAPLYDKAFSNPGASTIKLTDLATRPSFRKALFKATDLAAEEGVDPTALGVQFDAAGDPILERVPSYKTLDYIKRGLDDVLEGYRDKTTGKLVLDEQGRATVATRNALVARMDKANPDYSAARAAYAGPAKMRDALEKGAKALSKSPDDIMAMMKPMGDSEQEAFRLGVRKAITDVLASRRDGGDKVAVLMGTPKLRSTLTRVFGGNANFQRFVATLEDEAAMGRTHRSVFGNSSTAERMAQDAQTNDTGLAETAMDAALRGGKDGMWSALVSGLQKLREVDRFGAGEAGQRTRESVAALLSETDPAVLRELVRAAQAATRQQAIRSTRAGRAAVSTSKNVGRLTGMGLGSASKERP